MIVRPRFPRGPAGTLARITLVNTIGSGLWIASSALYLTTIVGMPPGDVALGLGIAALVSLVASTPLGYLADRRGPRIMQILFYSWLAVSSAAMLFVDSLVSFVVVASLTALADAGQRGARQATIAAVIPRDERVRTRALFRSLANVGITLGALIGGVGLAIGTAEAFRALIIGNALSYLGIAILALRLPHVDPVPRKPSGPRLASLRDKPFLAFVALDGVMSMHDDILKLVLPLWIVAYTDAPTWIVAACIVVNTAMVILFQVRMSRGTEELPGAVRAARGAGVLISAACLVFAASSAGSRPVAIALLLIGAFLHVSGELRQSAAGWGLSYGLSPDDAQGQYQATYAMGVQLGRMVSPLVLTSLVLGLGPVGWVLVALLMLVPALAIGAVVRWHLRRAAAGMPAGDTDVDQESAKV